MTKRGLVVAVAMVAACSHEQPRVIEDPDAPEGDDAFHAFPRDIEIQHFGDPVELLAFRVGDTGAWQALAPMATSFSVDGPAYDLLAVCRRGDHWETAIDSATTLESSSIYVPCGGYLVSPTTDTVAVTGTMKFPGSIWLGGTASGTTANWTYTLDVAKGNHGLIAFDGSKWSLAPVISIQAPTTIDVDTAATGVVGKHLDFTLHGGGTDPVSTILEWYTGEDLAVLDATGTGMDLPPDALVASDHLLVSTVHVGDDTAFREVDVFQFGGGGAFATEYTLLDPVVGATFAGTVATWTSAPATRASFQIDGATGNYGYRSVTRARIASATTLALPADLATVPGWNAVYDIGTPATYYLDFSADDGDATLYSNARSGGPLNRLESRACETRPSPSHCSPRSSRADLLRSPLRN